MSQSTSPRCSDAYRAGYDAGLTGLSQDHNPHKEESAAWWAFVEGWCDAVDFWDGHLDCPEPVTQWQVMLAAM